MTKSAFLRLILIGLLLVAQHAAVTHAVWHAHDSLPDHAPHHGLDGDYTHSHDEPSSQAQLCGFDLAFGQVLGAANGKAVVLAHPPLATERVGGSPVSCNYVTSFSPQSRGPPVLL